MFKTKIKITFILLIIILAIAAFLRLWQLNQIPPGCYPDIAMNGINALDSLKTGYFKVFYPDNSGREGVFFWLIALSFTIFGPSVWAIKIVAAVIGLLTVLGTYLLTKELLKIGNCPAATGFRQGREKLEIGNWKNEAIALLASFFLATSFWHTNFSRIGFRAIMVPFCLVFAFYFIFKGFRTQKICHFIPAGFFLGLGFYTYIAYRFVVFMLIAVFACYWLLYKKKKQQRKFLINTLYLLLTTFVVALPIGLYFLAHPADFFGRANSVSVFAEKNPFLSFGKSLISHLGMFNVYGDANWRHNFAGSPMLPWLLGILFILGIVLSIKNLIAAHKNKNCQLLCVYCLLFSWFIFMLAPGFLSVEGTPHALRTIGVIPVVYIFVGIGAYWAFEKIKFFFKTKKQILVFYLCIALLLSAITFSEFNKYFHLWGRNPEVAGAFSENYVEIGNYLNSLPDNVRKYVIVNQDGVPVPFPDGLSVAAQTPMFIERAKYGKIRTTYLKPENIGRIKLEKDTVIIPLQYDGDLFFNLSQIAPRGEIQKTGEVWIYKIK
jgi:4-amino-4-deoxy-L-arabinose transferase-like glycosyltransferase